MLTWREKFLRGGVVALRALERFVEGAGRDIEQLLLLDLVVFGRRETAFLLFREFLQLLLERGHLALNFLEFVLVADILIRLLPFRRTSRLLQERLP